ncbi:MAG: sensor histidine kinase [Deltaproteobacteria bacterium]|nr:MAG: sensor histidine kinase [Deltaproteobacteria bacterium]
MNAMKKLRSRSFASLRKRIEGVRIESIFFKQLASYLLLLFLLTLLFTLLLFPVGREHLEAEIGRKLQDIARISARNMPPERLALIREGGETTRMVMRLEQKLAEIQEATGVTNIFVFRPDMRALLDLDPAVPIGERYRSLPLSTEELSQLAAGEGVNTHAFENEAGQLVMEAFAPIREGRRLVAIVGIKGGAGELEIIEEMHERFDRLTFLALLFVSLVAFLLARSITAPLRRIAQMAQAVGKGDYSVRVAVRSRDEIGLLADTIHQMAEQIERREQALRQITAAVAHEIRNPLNSIKLLVSLLEEELEEAGVTDTGETIETLHYEIGKLNRFLTEFLTFARPVSLEKKPIHPRELVSAIEGLLQLEGRARRIEVTSDVAPDLPEVFVDRHRIEQVLLNLAINAVMSSSAGGEVHLGAHPGPDGKGVVFFVEDRGPGIPKEVFPNLFTPFFTTRKEGTGLGLANARKIVQEHGGEIRAENRPGGGARFEFFLPTPTTT